MYVCVCACMRACVRACVRTRACVCACVCVLDGEGSWVSASRALIVVQAAVYPTGCSDCLTGFHEPLSPPYRRHTCFEKRLARSLSFLQGLRTTTPA